MNGRGGAERVHDEGATMAEYVLVVTLVAVFAALAVGLFGSDVSDLYTKAVQAFQ